MSVRAREAALDVSYPAHPSQVPEIRNAVARVARIFGASDNALVQINLAVTEAATNAVLHAYRDRGATHSGDVRVGVEFDGRGCLDVRVRDRGIGMSPRADSPGLGLGLGLMAHESDRFEVSATPGGGTDILLRFQLWGARLAHTARSTSSQPAS